MTDTLTPMMRQYRRIKAELPAGVILFFRLGDFYEMFFEDAQTAAPILGVALTRRNGMPMCGVPYHAADNYLSRLIAAGRKVAICDQMEEPGASNQIVRREVTRIVTPGTITEDNILHHNRNHYLAGVCRAGEAYGLAVLDLSTGQFEAETVSGPEALRESLRRYAPGECIVPAEQEAEPWVAEAMGGGSPCRTSCEDWVFDYDAAYDRLVRHFGVQSLAGFGCEGSGAIVGAAGGVLYYVSEALRRQVGHVRSLRVRTPSDYLVLDEITCNNLDLLPGRGRDASCSLLGALDVTRTPMGGRKLRDWMLRPLATIEGIRQRHDAVDALCRDRAALRLLADALGNVRDLERLIGRLGAGGGNARDLVSLGQSLAALPDLKQQVAALPAGRLQALAGAIRPLPEVAALVLRAIVEAPPAAVKEGGMIRDGYHAELDDLRKAATEGRQWLAAYQQREQERTGIKSIKVRHNHVFGFYIEVSKGQLANVPPDYARKQTLVNAERFVTPELKEHENRILGAQDRAVALEYELFLQVRVSAVSETAAIQATAEAVAELDVLAALADRALALHYVRPTMTDGDRLQVREGRHPVIEQMPDSERFVPNDVLLDCGENQLMIITGPNMAGKSTYIRQVALTVILAQMGSFVPASEAEVGIVDRVFTRVGASDDLARGRSTFMVEMQETANILNNATPRSLVVLDEIGRGTSTFDGISIAWAVAEHLHNDPRVKARTLFATHYHELTDLALTMPGVRNYNVLVRESGDRVIFLRKIVPGASNKSYGIAVARLAGLPDEVIDRAREILANLEDGELGEAGQPKIAMHRRRRDRDSSAQMDLFGG